MSRYKKTPFFLIMFCVAICSTACGGDANSSSTSSADSIAIDSIKSDSIIKAKKREALVDTVTFSESEKYLCETAGKAIWKKHVKDFDFSESWGIDAPPGEEIYIVHVGEVYSKDYGLIKNNKALKKNYLKWVAEEWHCERVRGMKTMGKELAIGLRDGPCNSRFGMECYYENDSLCTFRSYWGNSISMDWDSFGKGRTFFKKDGTSVNWDIFGKGITKPSMLPKELRDKLTAELPNNDFIQNEEYEKFCPFVIKEGLVVDYEYDGALDKNINLFYYIPFSKLMPYLTDEAKVKLGLQ